jgi:hypothetical protein
MPLDGSMLTAIASELQAVASPSVSCITVRNVCYEYLKVFVTVSFKANEDSGLCQQQLNEVLINALSPWCSQTLPHLDIGCGIAYVDQLANLIRNQPYVAQQSAVCIAQTWQTGETHHLRWVNEGQAATPTTPWSVLVSAAEHGIELASGDQVPTEPPEGIGSMTVGADFIVEASHLLGAPPPRTGYNYVLAMRVPGAARPGPAPKPSPSQP